MKAGCLDILNCTNGHTSIYFNPSNKADVERSKRMIGDMMRRGYTFLVDDGGGNLVRVKDFDETKGEYVIESLPPMGAPGEVEKAWADGKPAQAAEVIVDEAGPRKKRGRPNKRLAAASTQATVVGRTAGGFPKPDGMNAVRLARATRGMQP